MSEENLINVFTTLRNRFLSMASYLLDNDSDADDVLQETFCRLWPRRDKITSQQEAEALTTTTLRNLCIDNLRKRKISTIPIEEQHDRQEESPDWSEEHFREIEKIIEQELTPLQNEILHRKEYNNETIEKIAKDLGMQAAAARMQLSRARKKIRECYQKRIQE